MKKQEEYTCALCKGTFLKEWSDEEAKAEWEKNFPGVPFDSTPKEVVCDVCYNKVMQ